MIRSLCVLLLAAAQQLPTDLPQIRHNSGEDIVPYFEGWIRNPDGTYDLVFGYFNRNWKQEFTLPPGDGNKVEPGGPDQGQPTYFLPRRHRWIYRLRLPADFGSKEVTWTITANGHSEVAYGNLLASEEINDRVVSSDGNLDPGQDDPNEPPSITIPENQSATLSAPLKLTATIRDDGLPKPRAAKAAAAPAFGAQIDRPAAVVKGVTVSWIQYGGPGKATFDAPDAAVTNVRFSERGTYRLRVAASDGELSTTADVVVTVK